MTPYKLMSQLAKFLFFSFLLNLAACSTTDPQPEKPAQAIELETLLPPEPGLPLALTGLTWAMSPQEFDERFHASQGIIELEGAAGTLEARFNEGQLQQIQWLAQGPLEALSESWGTGQSTQRGEAELLTWINPKQQVRIWLHPEQSHYLIFEPFQPLASLFPSPAPQLPPIFEGIELGMSSEALVEALPELKEQQKVLRMAFPGTVFGFDHLSGRLDELSLCSQSLDAAALEEQWGPKIEGLSYARWCNPTAKLCADLIDPHCLSYRSFLPLEKLIGITPEEQGIAAGGLFGMQGEALANALRKWGAVELPTTGVLKLNLPFLRYGAQTRLILELSEEQILSYRLELSVADDQAFKASIIEALSAKLGPAKASLDAQNYPLHQFSGEGFELNVSERPDQVLILEFTKQ